jgi:hypothetical protein
MRRALLLLALLALPAAGRAEGFVAVAAGVYVPAGSVGGVRWETVPTGTLLGGYDLGHVGAALSLGVLGTGTGPRLHVTAVPMVLRLRARLPLGVAVPYAFGAVGLAPTQATVDSLAYGATAFAGQAGAGVEFTLSEMFFLGLEAAWNWLRPEYSFGPLDLSGFTGQLALGLRL